MSDMLQLVGGIIDNQSGSDPLRRTVTVADLGDKLKHVEQHPAESFLDFLD